MKICITGVVKSGKTILANNMKVPLPPGKPNEIQVLPILCTDELIGKMDWSAESEEVAKWLDWPDSFILEGATVVRALRKWLANHPDGKPCNKVIYLRNSYPGQELSKGQITNCKATTMIWSQVVAELKARGVDVEEIDQLPRVEQPTE